MGGGAYSRADYDQERRSNERRLAPDAVAQKADRDLSEHRTCSSERTVRIIIPRIRQSTSNIAQGGSARSPTRRALETRVETSDVYSFG